MPDGDHDAPIRAAGAVVWRPGENGDELVLVHRPRYDDWSFPKGKSEQDEHVLATAMREVTEETGLRVILGRPLTPSVYQVNGRTKQVDYWVARCTDSVGFVPGHEVDHLRWLTATDAHQQLTYERDAVLLDEFSSGPTHTTPFIFLRHASAGGKVLAPGGGLDVTADLSRPLDARGVADAKVLAGLLASYGPCRVITSAAERCVATVRPYAAALGASIEVEPALTVTGEADGAVPEHGPPLVATLARSGAPTLICAHRENLPALIAAAFDALGAPESGQQEPLAKGEFVALHRADGALAAYERHALSALDAAPARRLRSVVTGAAIPKIASHHQRDCDAKLIAGVRWPRPACSSRPAAATTRLAHVAGISVGVDATLLLGLIFASRAQLCLRSYAFRRW